MKKDLKKRHKELPIENIGVLHYHKHQIKKEMEECGKNVVETFETLRYNVTTDNVVTTLVGDYGIQTDALRYLLPFALKYRNAFSENQGLKNAMSFLRKTPLVMVASGLTALWTGYKYFKKSKK